MSDRKKKYFIKQKLIGLGLIILSLLTIFIDMDITMAVVGVPLGLYVVFTKEMVITDEEFQDEIDKGLD